MAGDKNKLTEKQRQILEYLKQEILREDSRRLCVRSAKRFPFVLHPRYMHIWKHWSGKAISNEMQQNREPIEIAMKDSIPAALVQSRELHRKTPHPRVRLHRFR